MPGRNRRHNQDTIRPIGRRNVKNGMFPLAPEERIGFVLPAKLLPSVLPAAAARPHTPASGRTGGNLPEMELLQSVPVYLLRQAKSAETKE